jgi:hypothetical protein
MSKQDRVQVRRICDPPMSDDGARVPVDRLWPRGVGAGAAVAPVAAAPAVAANGLGRSGRPGDGGGVRPGGVAAVALGAARAAVAVGPAKGLASGKDLAGRAAAGAAVPAVTTRALRARGAGGAGGAGSRCAAGPGRTCGTSRAAVATRTTLAATSAEQQARIATRAAGQSQTVAERDRRDRSPKSSRARLASYPCIARTPGRRGSPAIAEDDGPRVDHRDRTRLRRPLRRRTRRHRHSARRARRRPLTTA